VAIARGAEIMSDCGQAAEEAAPPCSSHWNVVQADAFLPQRGDQLLRACERSAGAPCAGTARAGF